MIQQQKQFTNLTMCKFKEDQCSSMPGTVPSAWPPRNGLKAQASSTTSHQTPGLLCYVHLPYRRDSQTAAQRTPSGRWTDCPPLLQVTSQSWFSVTSPLAHQGRSLRDALNLSRSHCAVPYLQALRWVREGSQKTQSAPGHHSMKSSRIELQIPTLTLQSSTAQTQQGLLAESRPMH